MNDQNLKRPTSKEARELGRKGGIASGKARAERKQMREDLLFILSQPAVLKGGAVRKNPVTGEPMNMQQDMLVALVMRARAGDVKAAGKVIDILGEVVQQQHIEQEITIDVSES